MKYTIFAVTNKGAEAITTDCPEASIRKLAQEHQIKKILKIEDHCKENAIIRQQSSIYSQPHQCRMNICSVNCDK